MDDFEDRRLGRTTSMLARAAKAKAEGRQVLVIVHEASMIDYCMGTLEAQGLARKDFMTPMVIRGGKLRGYQAELFVDHAFWRVANHMVCAEVEQYIQQWNARNK